MRDSGSRVLSEFDLCPLNHCYSFMITAFIVTAFIVPTFIVTASGFSIVSTSASVVDTKTGTVGKLLSDIVPVRDADNRSALRATRYYGQE